MQIIDQIQKLILEDHWISAKSIAEHLGISWEWVGPIIHEDLDMRELSAKWVPECLNTDQKLQWCQSCEQLLEFFQCDPNDFLLRLVTTDETWLYHYDPETIDYLPKGQTTNAEYYPSLLVQLKDILKEKCRGKVTKGILFLHDNDPAHQALATQKKLGLHGLPTS